MARLYMRSGTREAAGRSRSTRGFIMMFTLIAVAVAGYVMIETAPDFSNYAVLAKSHQFDRSLAQTRSVISANPFYLTTADGYEFPPGTVLGVKNGILSKDGELDPALDALVVDIPAATPYVITAPSSAAMLGTTPVDPYIPARERSAVSWSASYNFVGNPAFYDLSQTESREDRGLQLFYVPERVGPPNPPVVGSTGVNRTDRFARKGDHLSIVSQDGTAGLPVTFRHLSASPDGSRLLGASNVTDRTKPPDILTFDPNGASRAYATFTTSHAETWPEWSPNGGRVSFRRIPLAPNPPPFYYTMVVKTPERNAAELDLISDLTCGGTLPCSNWGEFTDMGPGIWSPNGRMVAFWAVSPASGAHANIIVLDVAFERAVLPRPSAGGTVTNFPADCPLARRGTPITWRPDSDGFLYVDTGGNLLMAENLAGGAAGYVRNADPGGSVTEAKQLLWLPGSSSGSGVTSSTAFLALDSAGDLWWRRITDPVATQYRLATGVYTGEIAAVRRSWHTVGLSPGGTTLSYIDTARQQVWTMGVDGARRRVLFHIDQISTATPAGANAIDEVGFLAPPPAWSYMAGAFSRVTRASRASFDAVGWRRFTQAEALFPGDSRFGEGYMRIANPEEAHTGQILFDNGLDNFRIPLANPTRTVGNEPRILGKVEPTFSVKNLNYISRESQDITGGFPSDVFKQVVGASGLAGTTVLVTTGAAPCYGPDDRMLAVSKVMSDSTTFPPDTSAFPPVDMDVWIVEANGSPDPPPRNLTPQTTATAETNPSFSPDGRFVYFQRETQVTSRFLGNHTSGIYRVTSQGGSVTEVVGEGSIPPAWNGGSYVSALEFYDPAVSPCGTRLAFIARERLLGLGSLAPGIDTTRVGEIIGEALYVKDLASNAAPVCLLRSYDSQIAAHGSVAVEYAPLLSDGTQAGSSSIPTGSSCYADHGFAKPNWSGNGEEIYLTRTWPRNRWFPKKDLFRTGAVANNLTYRQILRRSQIIKVKTCHPRHDGTGSKRGVRLLRDNSFDPPADNFSVIVRNVPDGPHPDAGLYPAYNEDYDINPGGPGWVNQEGGYNNTTFDFAATGIPDPGDKHILNASIFKSGFLMQRITKDQDSIVSSGIALNTPYVLSGYVRSQGGTATVQAGQIMLQLVNNQGMLVSLRNQDEDAFQIGLADIGGSEWTRFSAGINFEFGGASGNQLRSANVTGPSGVQPWGDSPPFSLILLLYGLGPKAIVEFTGIKLERAYDQKTMAPTVFSPGWVLHSSSLKPDPRRADAFMFMR